MLYSRDTAAHDHRHIGTAYVLLRLRLVREINVEENGFRSQHRARMIHARKDHPLHSFAALFSLQQLRAYTHTLTRGKHKPVCRGGSSACVCVRPHRRGRLRSRPALAVVHTCLVRSGPVCVLIAAGVDLKAARDASRGRCYCYPTTTKARPCGRRPVSNGEWPSRFSAPAVSAQALA